MYVNRCDEVIILHRQSAPLSISYPYTYVAAWLEIVSTRFLSSFFHVLLETNETSRSENGISPLTSSGCYFHGLGQTTSEKITAGPWSATASCQFCRQSLFITN